MDVKVNNFVVVNDVFRSDLDIHINTFTDNHLLLYVYLQRFNNYRGEINFCLGWLYEDLAIDNNKRLQSELSSCFCDLIEFKLIELVGDTDIKSIDRNTRLVVKVVKNINNNDFTMLYDSEIDKIFGLDVDIRQKRSALMIYTIIASRINNKSKYAYPSYENFMSDLGMENNNRIRDSINLLQDEGLILWKNVGAVAINGAVETGNNVYVLCIENDHKAILGRAVADRTESYRERGYSVTKSKNGDRKRSLSPLIRHRQVKFDDGILDDKGMAELLQYEKEYYELIKDNEDSMLKQRFVLLDIESVNVEPGEKVIKGYFGLPNLNNTTVENVDVETGEIFDMDEEEMIALFG